MTSAKERNLNSVAILNDDVQMPMFAVGSGGAIVDGKMKLGVTAESITHALSVGYRMIDTSDMYTGAEELIGTVLGNLKGLERNEIFIVNKVVKHGREDVIKACHEELKKLGLSYIDLYLIHVPFGGKILEAYDALLELKSQGLIRSVGVANFGIQHIEGIISAGRPAPSVNQIELHPWQQADDIVDYCRKKNIQLMAYSPLTKAQKLHYPELATIASRYNKSPGQILLRWSVQKGYIPICMSKSPNHISENADVFGFTLSDDDMKELDSFKQEPLERPYEWKPTECPWEG